MIGCPKLDGTETQLLEDDRLEFRLLYQEIVGSNSQQRMICRFIEVDGLYMPTDV